MNFAAYSVIILTLFGYIISKFTQSKEVRKSEDRVKLALEIPHQIPYLVRDLNGVESKK
jgi:hypothetical protein